MQPFIGRIQWACEKEPGRVIPCIYPFSSWKGLEGSGVSENQQTLFCSGQNKQLKEGYNVGLEEKWDLDKKEEGRWIFQVELWLRIFLRICSGCMACGKLNSCGKSVTDKLIKTGWVRLWKVQCWVEGMGTDFRLGAFFRVTRHCPACYTVMSHVFTRIHKTRFYRHPSGTMSPKWPPRWTPPQPFMHTVGWQGQALRGSFCVTFICRKMTSSTQRRHIYLFFEFHTEKSFTRVVTNSSESELVWGLTSEHLGHGTLSVSHISHAGSSGS